MFLYSGNLPLLYSGNPKIKRGTTLRAQKRKSPVNLAIYRTLCGERGIRKQITTSHNYLKIRCLLIGKILLFSVYCL